MRDARRPAVLLVWVKWNAGNIVNYLVNRVGFELEWGEMGWS